MKKLTVYEATHNAKTIDDARLARINELIAERDNLAKQLNEKQEQLNDKQGKERLSIELSVKPFTCYTSKEYLQKIILQIQPVSDVIHLDWKRRQLEG